MAENPLFTVADEQAGATPNPLTQDDTVAIINNAKGKMRWDRDVPLTPGYDPVPVSIASIDANNVATVSIVSTLTGKVTDEEFKIDLDEREQCHAGLPSTPRILLGQPSDKHRIVLLMVCVTYSEVAKSASGKLFKDVAADAGIALSGKWPQTESAPEAVVVEIINAVRAGRAIDLEFLRNAYRRQIGLNPNARIPPALGPL